MRFHKLALCAAAAAAVWFAPDYGGRRAQAQDAGDARILELFTSDRSLRGHAQPASGPDPATVAALENSPIGKTYNTIRPARSLLLYDCGQASPWCNAPGFAFGEIFREAAKMANPKKPDPDGMALSWFNSARALDTTLGNLLPNFTLKTNNLQLLAIANRMDLAHLERGQWLGAEMHFVYGLAATKPDAQKAPDLTVIMEFKLTPRSRADFRNLAMAWINLSKISDADYPAQYLKALQSALRLAGFSPDDQSPSGFVSVNSRLNHLRTGPWMLSQLVLDPASPDAAAHQSFAPAALNDQVGKNANLTSKAYLDLWKQKGTVVEAGVLHYQIPPELAAQASQQYTNLPEGLGTPAGICDTPEVRGVLAMQQCTWCHTTETKTDFLQISNRLTGASSTPSGFLIGKSRAGANIHPRLADLYYSNKDVVWSFDLPYETFTGPPACTTPSKAKVTRSFHDVARRTLFLAAVQGDQTDSKGAPKAHAFSGRFPE